MKQPLPLFYSFWYEGADFISSTLIQASPFAAHTIYTKRCPVRQGSLNTLLQFLEYYNKHVIKARDLKF
jgi:hypothetical protein